MARTPVLLALASLAVVLSVAPVAGQCEPEWLPGPGVPGVSCAYSGDGLCGVRAMTKWDRDGAGPQPPVLVAAGRFNRAGNALAKNVALWNGEAWGALGSVAGRDVDALAVYGGQLYAGTSVSVPFYATSEVIHRWDGSAWIGVGSGITGYLQSGYGPGPPTKVSSVSAFALYQGQLIAAGAFSDVGSQPANNIVRWTGSSWQALGSGLGGASSACQSSHGRVRALAVYNGELYAGGNFGNGMNNVARWNGSAWNPVGSGVSGTSGVTGVCPTVSALAVHDGSLVAAGWFTSAGGQAASNVARWTGGQWVPLGTATPISALVVYKGHLFANAGEYPGPYMHRWDGASWVAVGASPGPGPYVRSLAVYRDELIAGGGFKTVGSKPATCIARWNGSTDKWSPMPGAPGRPPGPVRLLASYQGELIKIGTGWVTSASPEWGYDVAAQHPGTLQWRQLGDASGGLPPGTNPTCNSVAVHDGELFVGGNFTHMNGVPAKRIARWDGASWKPLHLGTTNTVLALVSYNGDLVAGGNFKYAGDQTVNRVARWDGAAWHAFGGGLAGSVSALAVHEGDLIAAGGDVGVPGQPAYNLMRWSGGAWQPVGGGVKLLRYAFGWYNIPASIGLGVHNGALIVGGITKAGGQPFSGAARWNGTTWSGMGPLWWYKGTFIDFRGDLVAAHYYNETARLDRWTGSTWEPLGGFGPYEQGWPPAATLHGQELVFAGEFAVAGGRISLGLARWGCACYPDCNHNGFLGGGDYTCFNAMYAQGHPYADCDGDGQLTPADFVCVQAKFVQGCP